MIKPDYSYLCNIQGASENPIMLEIEIENQPVCMEIDTGSGKSIISVNLYKDKFSNLPLKQSSLTFVTYTKEEIKPLGYLDVEVRYGSQSFPLPLYVIKTNSPPLFGREWLKVIQLNWKQIHKMSTPININQVLQHHDSLFKGQLEKLNGIEARLNSTSRPPKQSQSFTRLGLFPLRRNQR